MITPTKTYSSNPFVDNIMYYAKLMALNCTVKDEEEALSYETKETLYAADVFIGCIEGNTTYDMFTSIPKEILEKYIAQVSNLDIYTKNAENLKIHLNSFSKQERTRKLNALSDLARTVYIDHYDVMTHYISEAGDTYLIDNEELYNNCKNGTATYDDLFDSLPLETTLRILKRYLNSHDYLDIETLWENKKNNYSSDLTDEEKLADLYLTLKSYLNSYVADRADEQFLVELDKISLAMRQVFIDHYDMMKNRKYFADDATALDGVEDERYYYSKIVYDDAKAGTASYLDFYYLIPNFIYADYLKKYIPEQDIEDYGLMTGDEVLEEYFANNVENSGVKRTQLAKELSELYIKNYNIYLNDDIYARCKEGSLDYFDLVEYIPVETLKSILLIEIPEISNLQVYENNKKMLDSYLNTLPKEDATTIRKSINTDMQKWYPLNHVEKNNYYRALIGLPPLDSSGNPCVDTLERTYNMTTKSFDTFGTRYVKACPTTTYPEYHWRQELYKFDNYDVNILQEYGIMDDYIAACGGDTSSIRYRYIKYLGDSKLDLYTCRKAMNFQLIGILDIDDDVVRKEFLDTFAVNRDYVIRCVYTDAYHFQSDYYNKFMIIFILINTIMDMLTRIPDLIINRDVFDARCIKYLFESYGIPYYSEIPIKYQQAMLKNLNILIKYKSSTRNMVDICSLFGFADVKVFGYYLMKDRAIDEYSGEYVFDEDNSINYDENLVYVLDEAGGETQDGTGRRFSKLKEYRYYQEDYFYKTIHVESSGSIVERKVLNNDRDLYVYNETLNQMIKLKDTDYFTKVKADVTPASLRFIKVPIQESLTEYKGDKEYISTYDTITLQDEKWDGGLNHEDLERDILDYEFNAVRTKYISIETATDLTDLAFQVSYFYNMLYDSYYSEDALTVSIPYIKTGHLFRLTDVITFLFALTYYYTGLEDKIMYSPTQILYVKGYNFNEDLNTVLQDATAFTQEDSYGPLQDYEKVNIFDINERIAEDGYDYRKEFDLPKYYIKAFNLECDIDELDKWLDENHDMSLDDFVIDPSISGLDKEITLRQFYSLANSYYQKNIFKGDMLPLQYNNLIKYAYGYDLYEKIYVNDYSLNRHVYIAEKRAMAKDVGFNLNYIDIVMALVPRNSAVPTTEELLSRADNATIDELYDDNYILQNIFALDADTSEKIKDRLGEYYYLEVIDGDGVNYTIYVFNNTLYAMTPDGTENIAIYNKYSRSAESTDYTYYRDDPQYYIKNGDDYQLLIGGNIKVWNSDRIFIFGADKFFYRDNDTNEYIEFTDDKYFTYTADGYKVINYGSYYIQQDDGSYILDPENCYIIVSQNGEETYVLLKDIENYANPVLQDSDCYIRHSDGHFVRFDYTDYYIRTHQNDYYYYNEMVYKEEELFTISDTETEYFDPTADPVVYYKKISDFYSENEYIVYKDELYVRDPDGNFIPESSLVSPDNCYYYDYESNQYLLAKNNFYSFIEYADPRDTQFILVLQDNYDYYRYKLDFNKVNYLLTENPSIRYVYDSDTSYIIGLHKDKTYDDSSQVIVVLNREMDDDDNIADANTYNPSLHDNTWDENDWFYKDPSSTEDTPIGMNGENIWYYTKPGQSRDDAEDNGNMDNIGSGFYFDSSSYMGSVELVSGEQYYIAFDFECNFNGQIQIYCQADSSVEDTVTRLYTVRTGETIHISQVFTANDVSTPTFRFIKYGFDENPIAIGDYIAISNFRVVKSFSDDFIANDIPSFEELDRLYKTNTGIYKWLVYMMQNASDKKVYDIYKKLYDSLMISKYNKEAFKTGENEYARTYTEFLSYRDEILYNLLLHYKSLDEENMRKEISNVIIEASYALDAALSGDNYKYIYSYFPGVSTNFVQQYIFKIIDWFKSWKVQLLGINTVYRLGGSYGNIGARGDSVGDNSDYWVKILHDDEYRMQIDENQKEGFVYGCVKINPLDSISPSGIPYTDLFDLEDPTNIIRDKCHVRDRVRVIARTADSIEFRDNQTSMHIILNDDSTKVEVSDTNILTIKTINGDTFETVNDNQLMMHTLATSDDMFASQILEEINLLSGDFIDYEDKEEDYDE